MKTRTLLLAVPVAAALTLIPTLRASQEEAPSTTGTYEVDSSHSSVIFRIKHLDVSWFYGRLNVVSGSFTIDLDDPTKSSVEIAMDVDSIDTNSEDRDKHLKSADFFDAAQHPKLIFSSSGVEAEGESTWKLKGTLECKGKKVPLVAELEFTGSGPDPWGGQRAGFETRLTLDRMELGIGAGMPAQMLGEKVELIVSLEGVRR